MNSYGFRVMLVFVMYYTYVYVTSGSSLLVIVESTDSMIQYYLVPRPHCQGEGEKQTFSNVYYVCILYPCHEVELYMDTFTLTVFHALPWLKMDSLKLKPKQIEAISQYICDFGFAFVFTQHNV